MALSTDAFPFSAAWEVRFHLEDMHSWDGLTVVTHLSVLFCVINTENRTVPSAIPSLHSHRGHVIPTLQPRQTMSTNTSRAHGWSATKEGSEPSLPPYFAASNIYDMREGDKTSQVKKHVCSTDHVDVVSHACQPSLGFSSLSFLILTYSCFNICIGPISCNLLLITLGLPLDLDLFQPPFPSFSESLSKQKMGDKYL